MKIQRSWVLCVLTIIALVVAGHDARAQSFPAPIGPQAGLPVNLAPPLQPGLPGSQLGMPDTNVPQYVDGPAYMPGPPPGMAAGPMAYGPAGPMAYGPAGPMAYGPAGPMGYGPQANYPMPAGYMQPPGVPGPGAMGYGPQPAAYYTPQAGAAPEMGGPMQAGPMGDPESPYCGGQDCQYCSGHDDFDLNLLRWLLPYGEGGCGAQRWFDIEAEWVYMTRDDVGRSQPFTSSGLNGPIVLSTDDLNFDFRSGVRTTANIQLGAGNIFEVTYLGAFNWRTSAEVTGDNNLFSVMSQFGVSPFNGFDDTDRSQLHRIEYSSSVDSVEMNYRRRWMAPNRRVQGSTLFGIRYAYLDEDFRYLTLGPKNPGMMNYLVNTTNSMTGAQVGGDLWLCIIPGLSVGGEAKVGLYGNRATQRTTIEADSFTEPYTEKVRNDMASFLGDANLTVIWRINQNWTFRAGYTFLYLDAVALASDNFNPQPPFVAGVRTANIDDNGDVFYHGFTAGCEWMW